MKKKLAFILAAAVVAATACDSRSQWPSPSPSPMVAGSGRLRTESRTVSGVTAVTVSAGGELTIDVGTSESLEITAEDNILPYVTADAANDRLMLGVRGGMSMRATRPIQFHLTVRTLRDVVGSAGSQILMHDLDLAQMSARLSSGSMLVASGRVDRFDIDLSAGSRCDASMLRTRATSVMLSAGSHATLRVSDSLSATASAASVVEYFGDPIVTAHTSSDSTVRRVGP